MGNLIVQEVEDLNGICAQFPDQSRDAILGHSVE
jgi:hypothetical protein